MLLKQIVRASKVVTKTGAWKHGEKSGKSVFPISPTKGLEISAAYRWRCDHFEAAGKRFRVLVCYRNDLEKYAAYLGEEVGALTLLVARYEFHGSHEGWHCHAACSKGTIDPHRTLLPDRLPNAKSAHRRKAYGTMTDDLAMQVAYSAYWIPLPQPPAEPSLTKTGDLFK